jgi:RNA polymerase sporulation-specific sigma factor
MRSSRTDKNKIISGVAMKYKYSDYNDYELIELIKENNEEATEIMYQKYDSLIKNRVSRFNIKPSMFEDFVQEGRLALNKAIQTYKMDSAKTFNKFFDMVLQRRFITILKQNQKDFYNIVYVDDVFSLIGEKSNDTVLESIDDSDFTQLEKQIYQYRYMENYKPREIAEILKMDAKQVYNACNRIKKKISENR